MGLFFVVFILLATGCHSWNRISQYPRANLISKSHSMRLPASVNFEDDNTDCQSEGGTMTWKTESSSPNSAASPVSPPQNGYLQSFSSVFSSAMKCLDWTKVDSTPENIVLISDAIDSSKDNLSTTLLRLRRRTMLADLLRRDRNVYLSTARFMVNRIPRHDFPNVQGIPLSDSHWEAAVQDGDAIVLDDCELPKVQYKESFIDKALLKRFRSLVEKEIGYRSPKEGIGGLLEEGRYYKLTPEGQVNGSVNQHRYVKNVLHGMLPPALPILFRIFMSGLIPSVEMGDPEWLVNYTQQMLSIIPDSWSIRDQLKPGQQLGPWFYTHFLTSVFAPKFMGFLLGPCRINLRKDGHLGGMVVEKCKFLQVRFDTLYFLRTDCLFPLAFINVGI